MASSTESCIYHPSATEPASHLLFYIPGNPGCISYYQEFLTHLRKELSSEGPGATGLNCASIAFVGTPLANFGPSPDGDRPFSLQEQIAFVEQRLHEWTEKVRNDGNSEGELRVVLAGHSVGAFVGMEVLRRWMESAQMGTNASEVKRNSNTTLHPNVRIVGFIGLWPTITHIVRSPNGRRVGGLLRLTHLALISSIIVRILTLIVPSAFLRLIVRKATGFPDDALQTTLSFLKHPYQVRQALHMARDEMKEITEDRWQDDIWHAGPRGPKLTLLFGAEDEWVEKDAREELIQTRGATKERQGPRIEIDGEGIPHSFCIHDAKAVAERTAELIRDIIELK